MGSTEPGKTDFVNRRQPPDAFERIDDHDLP